LKKIHVYFLPDPQENRFLPGDRHLISLIKKLIRNKRVGGIVKVFLNLCKGFDQLGVLYDINLPFKKIKPGEPVIMLGSGRKVIEGYDRPNVIIGGIAMMTHPSEWPNLCDEYPVVKYLQHSDWANNVYIPYYGTDRCEIWPAGIDTDKWKPAPIFAKKYDLLIYNKIRWDEHGTKTN